LLLKKGGWRVKGRDIGGFSAIIGGFLQYIGGFSTDIGGFLQYIGGFPPLPLITENKN